MAHQVESANYYRLITLAVDVGSEVLRDVLLNRIHPDSVETVLQRNINNLNVLKNKRLLFQDQYDLLTKLPSPDLEELDITLLTFIFRNICNVAPANGWLIKPAVNDISLGADLWRLKDIRNNVFAHATSTNVTSVDFRQTWTELSAAIIRISQHGSRHKQQDVVQRIRNLEHQDLDPSSQTNKAAEIFLKWKEHDDKQKLIEEQDAKQDEILHVLTDLRDKVSDAKQDEILHVLTDRDKVSDAKLDEIHHLLTDVKAKVSDAKLDEIQHLLTDVKDKVSIQDNVCAPKDSKEAEDKIADHPEVCPTCKTGIRIPVDDANEGFRETLSEGGSLESEYLKQLWFSCIKLFPWLKAEMNKSLAVCVAYQVLNRDSAESIKERQRCIAVDELLQLVLEDMTSYFEKFLKNLEVHCKPMIAFKRKLDTKWLNNDEELQECLRRNSDLFIASRCQQAVCKQNLCKLHKDHKRILKDRISDLATLSALNDGFLSTFYFSLVDHKIISGYLLHSDYAGGASYLIETMEKSSKTIMKDFCKLLESRGKHYLVDELKLKETYGVTEELTGIDTHISNETDLLPCILKHLARLKRYIKRRFHFRVSNLKCRSIVFHLHPMADNPWKRLKERCSSRHIMHILEIIFPDEKVLSYFSHVENRLLFIIYSESYLTSNNTVEKMACLKLDLISGDNSSTEDPNTRMKRAKVVYSYEPEEEDDIKLEVGDLVEILKQEDEEWWEGLVIGKSGMFPSNFVEVFEDEASNEQKAIMDFVKNPIERSLETFCEGLEICDELLTLLRGNDLVPDDIGHKLRQTQSRASAIRCLMKSISPPEKGYRIIKKYAKQSNPYLYQELERIDEDQPHKTLLFQCQAQTKRDALDVSRTVGKHGTVLFKEADIKLQRYTWVITNSTCFFNKTGIQATEEEYQLGLFEEEHLSETKTVPPAMSPFFVPRIFPTYTKLSDDESRVGKCMHVIPDDIENMVLSDGRQQVQAAQKTLKEHEHIRKALSDVIEQLRITLLATAERISNDSTAGDYPENKTQTLQQAPQAEADETNFGNNKLAFDALSIVDQELKYYPKAVQTTLKKKKCELIEFGEKFYGRLDSKFVEMYIMLFICIPVIPFIDRTKLYYSL